MVYLVEIYTYSYSVRCPYYTKLKKIYRYTRELSNLMYGFLKQKFD